MKGGSRMRYFKYKNTDKTLNNAIKEQYKSLTENEKRTAQKKKIWIRMSTIVTLALFLGIMFAGIAMIAAIPIPSWWLWEILVIVGQVILGFGWFLVSLFLTAILVTPLWNKVESFNLPSMKKEICSKACAHLREHYQLEEPYIVTKCFDSTDENFKNHDVCIFVAYDELRITADLQRGFLYGERDLGCYAFNRNEITLSKRQDEKYLILELKANDVVFLLGYRAKSFIEKYFISQESE